MHVCAEHAEGSSRHGEGTELMSTSNATSRAQSPKIGSEYTVVHVRPSDTGTEVTAVITDGALTVGEREEEEEEEEEEEPGPVAEGSSLLQEHARPGERLVCRKPILRATMHGPVQEVVMPGSVLHHLRSVSTLLQD